MYSKQLFAFFLLLFALTAVGHAQSFDYEEKPLLTYKYLKTSVDITINTDKAAVKGSVSYLLKSNAAQAKQLVLDAPGITVDSVKTGEKAFEFSKKGSQLRVSLSDSIKVTEPFRVQIFYHADPRFGLLKDVNGTIWTSLLPKSHRHWMPSPDHPRVETTTTITLTVPASYAVAATGVKTNKEVTGLDKKKVTYRSNKPIPITSLSFATGAFTTESTSLGIKRIITTAESNTIDQQKQRALAQKAKNIITKAESAAGIKYPYQRLHVVVLNDHYWEQKPYGASVVYLYQNRGGLVHQLRRGIYAQWFGVYQHEGRWAAGWPLSFFQSALHYMVADTPILLDERQTLQFKDSTAYHPYSVERWNHWQKLLQKKTRLQELTATVIPNTLALGSGTFTANQYENIWYRYTGRPEMRIPSLKISATPSQTVTNYRVDIERQSQALKLVFTPKQGGGAKKQTIQVKTITTNGTKKEAVSLSGAKDSVKISVPAGVQNVLVLPANKQLAVEVHKPVPFILYQLDHAQSAELRKKAATQLGNHTKNPDLQLVITRYLNKKLKPEVKAAMLNSFASITQGASGTQQYFVDALASKHPVVRKAALKALSNYPNDKGITEKLGATIKQSDSLAKPLLNSYMQRIDSEKALDFVTTLVQQDTSGTKAIEAIASLAASGSAKEAVNFAKYYVRPVYPYSVRKKALSVLVKYDDATQAWSKRIEMLLTDLDPRIRYLTIKSLADIPGVKRGEVLKKYIPQAYDVRIYKAMK